MARWVPTRPTFRHFSSRPNIFCSCVQNHPSLTNPLDFFRTHINVNSWRKESGPGLLEWLNSCSRSPSIIQRKKINFLQHFIFLTDDWVFLHYSALNLEHPRHFVTSILFLTLKKKYLLSATNCPIFREKSDEKTEWEMFELKKKSIRNEKLNLHQS